MTIYTQTK